jgi:hypothetical protein
MSEATLKNGVRRTIASSPQEDHAGENTVSVVVAGGTIPWVLRFWARFGIARAYVGAVRIFPTRDHRVVAVCSMPGATQWEVEGIGATTATDELEIHFEGCESCCGPFGVHAIPGNSVDGSRSYRVTRGTAGTVTVTGEVFGWAAHAILAGASVSVAANPALAFGPIDVPQFGAVNGDGRGLVAPVSTWTFVNTAGFFIEYVAPGTVFDG